MVIYTIPHDPFIRKLMNCKTIKYIFGIIFCVAFIAQSKVYGAGTNKIDAAELAKMLLRVEPWPSSSTNYSKQGWDRLIVVAKYIQNGDPAAVGDTLNRLQG